MSGSLTLNSDTNLYRGGANLLKTDDAFLAVGSITTYGDLNMSGKLNVPIDNYIAWNGDVYLRRANTNVLAIDNNAGGLGALNVSIINVDHFKSASGWSKHLALQQLLSRIHKHLHPWHQHLLLRQHLGQLPKIPHLQQRI